MISLNLTVTETETEMICKTETETGIICKWNLTEMICRTEMMKSQFSFLMHCAVAKLIWMHQIHKKKQNS